MKKNKKYIIIVPIIIAVVLFVVLFIYFNGEDSNSFTVSERKWLQDNANIREDFEIINDYPIYGNGGVFDSFIDSLENMTALEFNKVPYYKKDTPKGNDFKFKIIKDESDITDNDIFLNEDVYVAIGKTQKKIDQITDFEDIT